MEADRLQDSGARPVKAAITAVVSVAAMMVLIDVAEAAGFVSDFTEDLLELSVFSGIFVPMMLHVQRTLRTRSLRVAMSVLLGALLLSLVLDFVEEIEALKGIVLLGKDGAFHASARNFLVIGIAASMILFGYLLLLQLDQAVLRTRLDQEALEKARHAREEVEASLALALQASGASLWSWDPDNDVSHWHGDPNPVFGIPGPGVASRADLMGAIHPDDRERVQKFIRELLSRGSEFDTEFRVVWPGGSEHTVLQLGRVYRGDDGRVHRVAGISLDVTDLRANERKLSALERQVQSARRLESLAVMAGGIAHDFNNLLTGVRGHASLALEAADLSPEARDHLQRIDEITRTAANLTELMLAYSGRAEIVPRPADLSRVITEFAPLLDSTRIPPAMVSYELEPNLPAVELDPGQLEQVFLNLMANAAEAIADRPGTIRVRTGSMEADEGYLASCHVDDMLVAGTYVFLEVSDDGSGIEPTDLERIFDPFFTTKFTGRGLGLAAVLGIVRGHEGAVRVDSRQGTGTTVRVLLPACGEISSAPGTERDGLDFTVASRFEPQHGPRDETVLVVDDEPVVRLVTSEMLRRSGFRVVEGAGGLEAIEACSDPAQEISAVLLDLTMPGMDGVQVFEELRKRRPELPIVLASGYSVEDVRARFRSVRSVRFLHKPFQPEELLAAISEALDERVDRPAVGGRQDAPSTMPPESFS